MNVFPIEIRKLTQSRQLEIHWNDARQTLHSYRSLRESCRCAACVSCARATGGPMVVNEAVTLTQIVPVGSYGVQLSFSDGHRRGIYPWPYLRTLG
jgi:DUF971 family protein